VTSKRKVSWKTGPRYSAYDKIKMNWKNLGASLKVKLAVFVGSPTLQVCWHLTVSRGCTTKYRQRLISISVWLTSQSNLPLRDIATISIQPNNSPPITQNLAAISIPQLMLYIFEHSVGKGWRKDEGCCFPGHIKLDLCREIFSPESESLKCNLNRAILLGAVLSQEHFPSTAPSSTCAS
jgi:hypothetical protein